jgi:hypothetical protein
MFSSLNLLWTDWSPNLSRIALIILLSGIAWWVSHRILGILIKRVRRREREGGWRVSTLISMIRSVTV